MLFVVVGILHASIPNQLFGYYERFHRFTGGTRLMFRGFSASPAGIRAFGVFFTVFAACMLALFIWQSSAERS